MNFPGFLFGFFLAAAGVTGILLWMRLAGLLKHEQDPESLGFDARGSIVASAGEEEFSYAGSAHIGSSVGHRLVSLGALVVLILGSGAAAAVGLYAIGKLIVSVVRRFILQSP